MLLSYLKDHWCGRHSLARSVLVNFLPGFLLLWFALEPLVTLLQDDAGLSYAVLAVYAALAFGVLLTWQVVGVIRSSERLLADYGSALWGRSAQGLALAAVLGAIIAVSGAAQRIGARQGYLDFERRWEAATTRSYDLSIVEGTRIARLRGDMQNGTTRALEEWLGANPGITGIVLDSDGGRVYEGRGVARVIRERGLDTYTLEGCYSACTTAFIAGARRYLGVDARLGFHQYRYDAGTKNLGYLDSAAEQEKDLAYYRDRDIDRRFLERVFEAADDDMWFPPADLLLEYRVIHGRVDEALRPVD